MAVVWSWDEKCGEATFMVQFGNGLEEITSNLYKGNAYLIFVNEFEEDGVAKYSLNNFWVDEQHMKNSLGLNPKRGEDNYNYFDQPRYRMTKIRINKAKCRYWKKIIAALAQSFDDLIIELYSEREVENNEEKS